MGVVGSTPDLLVDETRDRGGTEPAGHGGARPPAAAAARSPLKAAAARSPLKAVPARSSPGRGCRARGRRPVEERRGGREQPHGHRAGLRCGRALAGCRAEERKGGRPGAELRRRAAGGGEVAALPTARRAGMQGRWRTAAAATLPRAPTPAAARAPYAALSGKDRRKK
ncbi:hypothetical protein PVAP13_9KG257326 [Panicum virgatum]|uniref:Uncharacterized protein n=1 Tax=Panicum virgatum TaxID=38727 RepID=A0A8T0NP80_PANVG|nr:hypothetical protein PVAP13_9KG257326 [Panicum virgatum]